MPVSLPAFFHASDATACLKACHDLMACTEPVVDASQLVFVDPFGICLLGATFCRLRALGRTVRVINLNPSLAAYLTRMDLFDDVVLDGCAPAVMARHDQRHALVELTRLTEHGDVDQAANRLSKALVGQLPNIDMTAAPDEMTGMTPAETYQEPLQYALSELLENALTHARRAGRRDASVWVASQYYPKAGLIRCAVVDDGCGFLETLRTHRELLAPTHLAAILAAMRPRVSCNREVGVSSDSINQGVGLTTTCRIAEAAGGGLIIVSGDAVHSTYASSRDHTCDYWQGVAISLTCQRQRLPDVRFRDLLPPRDGRPLPPLRFE